MKENLLKISEYESKYLKLLEDSIEFNCVINQVKIELKRNSLPESKEILNFLEKFDDVHSRYLDLISIKFK